MASPSTAAVIKSDVHSQDNDNNSNARRSRDEEIPSDEEEIARAKRQRRLDLSGSEDDEQGNDLMKSGAEAANDGDDDNSNDKDDDEEEEGNENINSNNNINHSSSTSATNLGDASLVAPYGLQPTNPPTANATAAGTATATSADDQAAALSALIRNQLSPTALMGSGSNVNGSAGLLMAQMEMQRLAQQQQFTGIVPPQQQQPILQPQSLPNSQQQQQQQQPAASNNGGAGGSSNSNNNLNSNSTMQQLIMNAQLLQQQQHQLNVLSALQGRGGLVVNPQLQQQQQMQQLQQLQQQQQPQMLHGFAFQQMLQQQNQYSSLMALAAAQQRNGGSNAAAAGFGVGNANNNNGIPMHHHHHPQLGMAAAQSHTQHNMAALYAPSASLGPSANSTRHIAPITIANHPTGQGAALPTLLAQPDDNLKLSSQQVFLRHQIEAFRACEDDILTHTRGRNKPVAIGQVGIRCRFCSHLQVARRQKGSTYFPASLNGLYQAAQNMNTSHMSSGICTEMPLAVKQEFLRLSTTKEQASAAGRPYWANAAAALGLVDTEDGIRHIDDVRARITAMGGSVPAVSVPTLAAAAVNAGNSAGAVGATATTGSVNGAGTDASSSSM
ncbi:hypothetical protein MPSEU_000045900 [Mayamaea pseudoterrestris]|nr:hypothetical protein MPSEU_000045900 [Mayamaea pseudoterrestris]